MCGPTEAQIQFATKSRSVRFFLPLPDKSDKQFWFTPARRQRVDSDRAHANWEQACRQRWRALLLAIKAKLESVECGISTFEQEFMAFIVNPSTGRTIGEEITPLIEERYQNPEARRPLGLPAPTDNGD
jgi:hypothetical protein